MLLCSYGPAGVRSLASFATANIAFREPRSVCAACLRSAPASSN